VATYTKEALSGSSHGRGILVVATSSPGTTIHTGPAGTTSANEDVVTLFAYNSDTVSRTLTVQWGGTTSPDDDIKLAVPSQAGLTLVVSDLIVRNSNVVKAYCDAASKVTIHGYANRIS
jgi:hypothetical protein